MLLGCLNLIMYLITLALKPTWTLLKLSMYLFFKLLTLLTSRSSYSTVLTLWKLMFFTTFTMLTLWTSMTAILTYLSQDSPATLAEHCQPIWDAMLTAATSQSVWSSLLLLTACFLFKRIFTMFCWECGMEETMTWIPTTHSTFRSMFPTTSLLSKIQYMTLASCSILMMLMPVPLTLRTGMLLLLPRFLQNRASPFLWRHLLKLYPDTVSAARLVDVMYPPRDIDHKLGQTVVTATEARSHFTSKSYKLGDIVLDQKNLHPVAAARRLAAIKCFEAWTKRYCLTYYDVSMSNRSVKHGVTGSATIIDFKDGCSRRAGDLKLDARPDNRADVHIDTFTHLGLTEAHHELSTDSLKFIFTWNPKSVAGSSDENKFRYEEDGVFLTEGHGFRPYEDKLFDFEDDNLLTSTTKFEWEYSDIVLVTFLLLSGIYDLWTVTLANQGLYNCVLFHARVYSADLYYITPSTQELSFGASELGFKAWFFNGWTVPTIAWQTFTWYYPYFAQPVTPSFWSGFWSLVVAIASLFQMQEISVFTHKVVRIDVGESRSMVVIIPNTEFRGMAARLRPGMIKNVLSHRVPEYFPDSRGRTMVIERVHRDVMGFSAAYLGASDSYFISDTTIDHARAGGTAKHSPTVSSVILTAKSEELDVKRLQGNFACELALIELPKHAYSNNGVSAFGHTPNALAAFAPVDTVVRPDVGREIKAKMAHHFMTPIITGAAFIHAHTREAHKDVVTRRLKIPHAQVKRLKLPPVVIQRLQEYAGFIRKDAGMSRKLIPIDEHVYVETRNAAQLTKFETVMNEYDIVDFSTREGHIKAEIASNPSKAGRGICSFPPGSQALGGRIALAYAIALHSCPWLGCGKNPQEMTDDIMRICNGADFINATDFSAQDATIELVKRAIELYLLLELFDEGWHDKVAEWHASDYYGAVCYGGFAWFDLDGSRGSGSSFTTLGNTPLTGFFAYNALREQGHQPTVAYAKLGCYSGDDGATANLTTEAAAASAAALGFIVKSEIMRTNIPYLGRIFEDPVGGSRNSISDPKRAISKLSATLQDKSSLTPVEAMVGKAICLQITDKHSDFFGLWSRKVLEDAPIGMETKVVAKMLRVSSDHSFHALRGMRDDVGFDTAPGWAEELFEMQMPNFDFPKFNQWLDVAGKDMCPTLWEAPEPDGVALSEAGPLEIHAHGVGPDALITHYSNKTQPKVVKKKGRRTKAEFKKFKADLKEAGLLDEWSNAAADTAASDEENARLCKIRRGIERRLAQS